MRDGCESLEWRLPNYQQLLRMVKNPTYAGAFAWGRSGVRSKVVDGRSRKTVGHRLEMDQWQILLKDHLSAPRFAAHHGVNDQTLVTWIKKDVSDQQSTSCIFARALAAMASMQRGSRWSDRRPGGF